MRVLELCLSHGYGGLELYVGRLAVLLGQRGHQCRAVARPGTRLADQFAQHGVPTDLLRTRLHPLPLLAARRLARIIEREAIDVVHVHWSRDLPLAALARRLCRRPHRLVHSRHMAITRPKHDPWHRFIYRSLDRLVVLSEVMRSEAQRYLPVPDTAIEVVYLGVPAPAQATPISAVDDDHVLRVGLFGRIEPFKAQHLLIEAVDLLRTRGITVHAEIIGHAMDERYLDHLKHEVERRGLTTRIRFSGFQTDPMRLMAGFDVIVLTTRRETFGLVLVEAMRCGVAVVGTDAGGVPEIIGHENSGLLFPPDSADGLATQLGRLAAEPSLRHRLAAAGKARADDLFSEEAHLQHIEQLLAETN